MLPAEIFASKDTLPALSLMPSSKFKHLMPATNWLKTAFSFPRMFSLHSPHCDVMEELQSSTLADALRFDTQADLSVSFGFLHHIPLPEWRATFLKALVRATKPGGFSCVSLWRFLTDERTCRKAKESTASGIAELGYPKEQFGKGDCLLGWKNEKGAYRYCHSFSDEEINDLVSAVSNEAYLKARFQAEWAHRHPQRIPGITEKAIADLSRVLPFNYPPPLQLP